MVSHGLGRIVFKRGCAKWFYGIFYKEPIYGEVTFCNGITYTGFINNNFDLEGEGIIDRTNYNNKSSCKFMLSCFKDVGTSSSIKGFFKDSKLVFEIKETFHKDDYCMKRNPKKCTDIYNSYCLTCRKLYCYRCGNICHAKEHDIIFNYVTIENIDFFEEQKEKFDLILHKKANEEFIRVFKELVKLNGKPQNINFSKERFSNTYNGGILAL